MSFIAHSLFCSLKFLYLMNLMDDENKITVKTMRDIRGFAFHLLYVAESWDYSVSIDEIVDMFRSGYDIDITDDSRAISMAFSVMEEREELDTIIKPLLKNWKIDRLGICTLLILRLAIWELKQKNLPPSIVINEAIELAKNFAEKDSYKFVNGILDEVCKNLNICDEDHDDSGDSNEQSNDQSDIK
ncbi:transcription antitermination factor NusB [Candidatus Dependentiae bacterium]|nr:transcription antitermination factor NusB [Candidatus Dependentiae bacterium]MBU4387282.1 transcription antitermination factor NusB [Candidatus Dependentiae bacterium]MCG2756651.1 transcription antitermination factor NusB [Candidatus Dependentiae bacterium]